MGVMILAAGLGLEVHAFGELTTKQMQQQDTFQQAGWDFVSTWAMQKDGYPVLQWELARDAAGKP
jgi:hypothetical protein